MGPIESNLRLASRWLTPMGAAMTLRSDSWNVCIDAAKRLGVQVRIRNWPDIMSEAIEAAEALGL